MAEAEDLKRVELKVSVNCCEGCRKKVLKALSMKGVLSAEIDPNASRVAVVGNVEAEVLLKRLSKVGKTAELVLLEEARKAKTEEDGKKKTTTRPEETDEKKVDGEGGGNNSGGADKLGSESESKKGSNGGGGGDEEASGWSRSLEHPAMASRARTYCPMEAIALPVAISAYPAPAAYCFGGHYCYEMPMHRAAASAAACGNYYSDDDSVGCLIM